MLAQFERFVLTMTRQQAQGASHQGACDDDVAELVKHPAIRRQLDRIGPDAIRAELREYGAWQAEDYDDDEANRRRIVWIAAGSINESA